jgi:glycosyltransferase involved in cell wall biosynthesis
MIPPVTHSEAIKAIQCSDVLLIVQPDTALQIPGKLFEYIAASKPVMALACSGATDDLVKQENLGMVADSDDINGIKKIIIQLLEYKKNNTFSSIFGCEDSMKFESNNLTRKLTELFDRTINNYE